MKGPASPDALLLALSVENPEKYSRLFVSEDFSTQGGVEAFNIIRKGGDLQTLNLTIKASSSLEEAEELLAEAGSIKVTSSLVRDVLREIPLQRLLGKAITNPNLDIARFRQELEGLDNARLDAKGPPKKGEWRELITRAMEERGKAFATGIPRLDGVLEGGLWVGELGFIQAPTGVGKTSFLVHLGSTALQDEHTVLHVTPEVVDYRLLMRYAQNALRMTPSELKLLSDKQLQTRLSRKFKAPLRIVNARGQAGRSLAAIADEIYLLEPGSLIIVDAPEHIDSGGDKKSRESWDAIGEMVMALRDIAEDRGCGIWLSTQGNRSSIYDQKAARQSGLETVAESIKKAWSSDVHLILNQHRGDENAHRVQIAIAKARERENPEDIHDLKVKYNRKQQRFYGYTVVEEEEEES